MESGDLGFVETFGKAGQLSLRGGVWIEGVGGDWGVGGHSGDLGRLVAAAEQTGEEAGEAQGGDLKEIAFGARSRQEGHELGSKVFSWVKHRLRQAYRGASGATMPRLRHAVWWKGRGLEDRLLSLGIDNKGFVERWYKSFLFIDIGGFKDFFGIKYFFHLKIFANPARDKVHQNT